MTDLDCRLLILGQPALFDMRDFRRVLNFVLSSVLSMWVVFWLLLAWWWA